MGKIYIAKNIQEKITEKVIHSISDLCFLKNLTSEERNQLATLFHDQYKQGFINGTQLRNENR